LSEQNNDRPADRQPLASSSQDTETQRFGQEQNAQSKA